MPSITIELEDTVDALIFTAEPTEPAQAAEVGGVWGETYFQVKLEEAMASVAATTECLQPRLEEIRLRRQDRAAVELMSQTDGVESILVTSSNAGDGKSTTASNLAIVLSSVARRTVLVDTFRRGRLHEIFDPAGSPPPNLAACIGNPEYRNTINWLGSNADQHRARRSATPGRLRRFHGRSIC